MSGHNDVTKTLDVYDSELVKIGEVYRALRARAEGRISYEAFEREAIERFQEAGFTVVVNWYETNVGETLIPDITITGRIDPKFVFDRDRQTHEVTHDVLGFGPSESEVIKTDQIMIDDFVKKHSQGHGH